MYNIVGFQTKLKYSEQKRVFRTIPGLGNAEFMRFGSIHRNTYINSPKLIRPTLQVKDNDLLYRKTAFKVNPFLKFPCFYFLG